MNLQDIAKLAGVSRSTVSRVINNDPKVSDAARQRVEETIASVGFQPNASARALASRRTGVIGLLLPRNFSQRHVDSWFVLIMDALLEECRHRNLGLMLLTGDVGERKDTALILDRFVNSRLTDGLIIIEHTDNDTLTSRLVELEFPFVFVGESYIPRASFVDVDHRTATADITRLMLADDVRSVALLRGPLGMSNYDRRREGFYDAISDAGLDRDQVAEYDCGYDERLVDVQIDAMLRRHQPDAICALSDWMAHEALHALAHRGLRVPDDIRVVSFDDFLPATNDDLGLTSVVEPVAELASLATTTLLELINGDCTTPLQRWFSTDVTIRSSHGPPVSDVESGAMMARKEKAIVA